MKYLVEKHYKKEELEGLIGLEFITKLLDKGILSIVSNTSSYSLQYVGLIFWRKKTLAIIPKFLQEEEIDNAKTMQLILKVLRTYEQLSKKTKNKDEDFMITNLGNRQVSNYFIAYVILNDFLKNGYYTKNTTRMRKNGEGEINWEKTISDITPIISNRVPYYLETYNINKDMDTQNKLILLHKIAVKHCYEEYGELLGLKNIEIEKSVPNIEGVWSEQFIHFLLDKELRSIYSDRKILVIKALKTFFTKQTFFEHKNLTLFGTKSFNNVWEHVCSFVFKNEFESYEKKIPKPLWTNLLDNDFNDTKHTLRPDVIRKANNVLLILDAKYYNIKFINKNLTDNPGVEDVVKQLIYEKALDTDPRLEKRNVFLFPSNSKQLFTLFGVVNMDFISPKPISLIYLSHEEVFNLYINRMFLSDEMLLEFINILK